MKGSGKITLKISILRIYLGKQLLKLLIKILESTIIGLNRMIDLQNPILQTSRTNESRFNIIQNINDSRIVRKVNFVNPGIHTDSHIKKSRSKFLDTIRTTGKLKITNASDQTITINPGCTKKSARPILTGQRRIQRIEQRHVPRRIIIDRISVRSRFRRLRREGRHTEQRQQQKEKENWMRGEESNPRLVPTKNVCYHYNTPQSRVQSSRDN